MRAAAWLWIPLARVINRVFGLPDTLHPDTWAPIGIVAAFTPGLAVVGAGFGVLIHRYAIAASRPPARRA